MNEILGVFGLAVVGLSIFAGVGDLLARFAIWIDSRRDKDRS